jgi:hypothetical protein
VAVNHPAFTPAGGRSAHPRPPEPGP